MRGWAQRLDMGRWCPHGCELAWVWAGAGERVYSLLQRHGVRLGHPGGLRLVWTSRHGHYLLAGGVLPPGNFLISRLLCYAYKTARTGTHTIAKAQGLNGEAWTCDMPILLELSAYEFLGGCQSSRFIDSCETDALLQECTVECKALILSVG